MNLFPTLRTLGAAMTAATAASGTLAQPVNNTCATATPIVVSGLGVAVTTNGSTLNATSDIMQTCGLDDELDVWYSFTAPAAGIWTFDTLNSVLFDTTLAIYSSCGGTLLACNDDISAADGYFWSAITLTMTANQSVRIRVAGNNLDADIFQLNIVGNLSNANNSCSVPDPITAGQPRSGSTLQATTDVVLPPALCGNFQGSRGGRDVFYSFTPTASGPYKITLCSSGFDTTLAVLTNCSGSAASVVACNDDNVNCTFNNRSEIPTVGLTAGTQYLIRIAGFDFEPPDYGTYTVLITPLSFGPCCRGATCAFISPADCAVPPGFAAGRSFGNFTTCNAAGNSTFPCCHGDYNKVNGVTVQDIFDFLSDWFRGSGLTAVGTNGNVSPTVQHIFDFLNVWFAGGC